MVDEFARQFGNSAIQLEDLPINLPRKGFYRVVRAVGAFLGAFASLPVIGVLFSIFLQLVGASTRTRDVKSASLDRGVWWTRLIRE
jgi:hypothetical protein